MTLFSRLFERRATTYQQVWGADLDSEASPFGGRQPSRDAVLGLSAVFACIRLLADTVATLPFHAYEATGDQRAQLDPQPAWIERPVPRDPSITRVVHFQQVLTSLLLDGNSFTLAAPNIFNPAELRVLDPRMVDIDRQSDSSVVYRVRDYRNQLIGEFDWTQIVHIPLIRLPGELRGVSPLEAERQLFSGAISVEELGARFARNGLWLSAMVEAPQGVQFTEEQANALIAKIEAKYSGSRHAGRVGILTGGATLKQLSVTPEQAQFLQTMQYTDERIFRVFRVPPSVAGMTKEGAVSFASSREQSVGFEKHTIRPLVETIEPAYSLLLGPGRYVRFSTKGLLRADPKTQADIYHLGLTDTWLDVDDVRRYEDMTPFGGERGGKLQTPNNNAPGNPPADEADDAA